MARRIIVAPAAAEGFRAARDWLTQPGAGPVGHRRWKTVRDARILLREWPYAGAVSPDHPNCRYLVSEGYFIIYQIDPDTGDRASAGDVIILAVFAPGIGSRAVP